MQAAVNVRHADRECVDKRYHAPENIQLDFFYIVSRLLECAQPAEGSTYSLFVGANRLYGKIQCSTLKNGIAHVVTGVYKGGLCNSNQHTILYVFLSNLLYARVSVWIPVRGPADCCPVFTHIFSF